MLAVPQNNNGWMEAKQLGKRGDGVTVNKWEEEGGEVWWEREKWPRHCWVMVREKNEKESLEMRENDVRWGRKVGKKIEKKNAEDNFSIKIRIFVHDKF